jgi:uncharacterized membrane protein YcaP (DUF421 family)
MSPDWSQIFGLNVSPAELIIRGTAMYLFLFLLFRVAIRRRVGTVGMADILVIVIIADAAQNGMSGEYRSVTEGAILVATIVAWNVVFDWLTYKSSRLQRILEPPPLLLVDNGRLLRKNLRKEYLSEEELRAKLREHGVSDYSQVAKAHMESDGQISVIKQPNLGSGSQFDVHGHEKELRP